MKEVIGASLFGTLLLGGAMAGVHREVQQAQQRLDTPVIQAESEAKPTIAIADDAEASYCTPQFKEVLQRVLHACGLVGENRRGCRPDDVQRLASIGDEEFNALFLPLKERGGVILFDDGVDKLDEAGQKLVEELWLDRRGARYFFVVARASKKGTRAFNQALSHRRANSVKFHVQDKYQPENLDKEVGTMWLGYDYAQLGAEYCKWNVSRKGKPCNAEAINRSAFVSWVDCRL
jgi:outer membrane protein OmpA-like peptidoglycan-associated protein